MNTGSLYLSVIGIALCGLFFASPSKTETVWNGETFGDWRFECGSPAEGLTQCALVQSIIDTVTNQTMVRLSFAQSAVDGTITASVLLPLGVELAENATVHYGVEKMSLPYRICVVDGCWARRSMAPDELRRELLSNLVFEGSRSCGDLVCGCGFNSVFEPDACDDFGQVIKAA